jgi:hypothetical protein
VVQKILLSVGLVLKRESGEQLQKILGDRLPEEVGVDVEVVAHEAVADPGGGRHGTSGIAAVPLGLMLVAASPADDLVSLVSASRGSS